MKNTALILILFCLFFLFGYNFLKSEEARIAGSGESLQTEKKDAGTEDIRKYMEEELKIKLQEEGLSDMTITDMAKAGGFFQEIDGGIWLHADRPRTLCVEETRGVVWFLRDESGDKFSVCARNSEGVVGWVDLNI